MIMLGQSVLPSKLLSALGSCSVICSRNAESIGVIKENKCYIVVYSSSSCQFDRSGSLLSIMLKWCPIIVYSSPKLLICQCSEQSQQSVGCGNNGKTVRHKCWSCADVDQTCTWRHL